MVVSQSVTNFRAGKMAHPVVVPATKPEDLIFISRTHMVEGEN